MPCIALGHDTRRRVHRDPRRQFQTSAGGTLMTTNSPRRLFAVKPRAATAAAVVVAGALLLGACGDQTKDDDKKEPAASAGSSKAADSSLKDKLPAEIRDKGVIKVGSDIAYPPVEYKDKSGKVVAIDV